jgi:cytochrome P450
MGQIDHAKNGVDAGEDATCPHLAGYDPLSAAEMRDPYPSFARARAEAPVFFSPEYQLWTVARQEDVLRVLRDEEAFSAAGALPVPDPPEEIRDRLPEFPWKRSTVATDPPAHKEARGLIQAPFTRGGLKSREPFIRARAESLLEPLAETGRIEFVNDYCFKLSLGVIGDIVGADDDHLDLLLRTADAVFRAQNAGLTGDAEELLKASAPIVEAVEYVDGLIEDRRREAADDYTSVMVRREMSDGRPPSTDEVRTRLFDLLVAGFETSAQMMAHGVATLLEHREQWDALRADPELVEGAVEEMLRHRALVKRIFRSTKVDVEVGGVTIPQGALVALLLPSANRDEEAWERPDDFDIRRGRSDHLTFGKWTHFCVGAPLARLEIAITVETLLERFPEVRVVEGSLEEGPADLRLDTIGRLELELGMSNTKGSSN